MYFSKRNRECTIFRIDLYFILEIFLIFLYTFIMYYLVLRDCQATYIIMKTFRDFSRFETKAFY